jgi:hypothetical protein
MAILGGCGNCMKSDNDASDWLPVVANLSAIGWGVTVELISWVYFVNLSRLVDRTTETM